jgi:acyl carrier protein
MDNTPAWDSAEHLNVCLMFEQKFGVPMTMDMILSATSIRALAALIP